MISKCYPFLCFLIFCVSCKGQETPALQEALPLENEALIKFYNNYNLTNTEEPYFVEIAKLWKQYLSSYNFMRDSPEWSRDNISYPEFGYIQLGNDLRSLRAAGRAIQCNILGIVPVEHDHYLLRSMFTQVHPNTAQVKLNFIITAYARKIEGQYKLINSSEYHMLTLEKKVVGEITYYIHPEHQFDSAAAEKMNQFNKMIAAKFEMKPKSYDYFVANNTTHLAELLGMDFFFFSNREIRTGGMADAYNQILYAGNNSEYYPHEAVHLYTGEKYRRQYHPWVDEGIATFFGGSSGYTLDWHIQKLKSFLAENPDYDLSDLKSLEKDIPNGDYATDFRYVIGGYLMKLVYKKEGMQGFDDCLQAGRSEEDYFGVLNEKLGIARKDFGSFIKSEMKALKKATPALMSSYKY